MNRNGFTLMELLVTVVAVLMIAGIGSFVFLLFAILYRLAFG